MISGTPILIFGTAKTIFGTPILIFGIAKTISGTPILIFGTAKTISHTGEMIFHAVIAASVGVIAAAPVSVMSKICTSQISQLWS